jgi:uncharacterized protein
MWMWDAYTTTKRFPNSQPRSDGVNYIRNSIKVTIDAYNGSVTFYQVDPTDGLANTWNKVYKGLFTPVAQMPADLQRHIRYPEDLLATQGQVLATYHMSDPQIFYNKEDVWEIPKEIYGNSKEEIPVVPYNQMLQLPGEAKAEFALLQPFTPLTKKNLSSLLIARQDVPHYGELVSLAFPKDKLVFGPAQAEARISNDPVISSQLTLWDQSGSEVIRGNLLVVPVGDAVMYFEPLFLQATQSGIPELTRVIVSYGDQVVMEPTLQEALVKIFGAGLLPELSTPVGGSTTTTTGQPGGTTTTTAPPATTTTTAPAPTTTSTTMPAGGTTTTTGAALPTDAKSLIQLAEQHYQAAVEAQKAGDWAEYGRQIQALGQVLSALQALSR